MWNYSESLSVTWGEHQHLVRKYIIGLFQVQSFNRCQPWDVWSRVFTIIAKDWKLPKNLSVGTVVIEEKVLSSIGS